jgi:hypothetical protein
MKSTLFPNYLNQGLPHPQSPIKYKIVFISVGAENSPALAGGYFILPVTKNKTGPRFLQGQFDEHNNQNGSDRLPFFNFQILR